MSVRTQTGGGRPAAPARAAKSVRLAHAAPTVRRASAHKVCCARPHHDSPELFYDLRRHPNLRCMDQQGRVGFELKKLTVGP